MKGPIRKFSVLGILNLTPDSFSDGGLFYAPQLALDRTRALLDDGAHFVDVGAESTRPGSKEVSEEHEWKRLEPLLSLLRQSEMLSKISIDTRKYSIMRLVTEMGVAMINCVGPIPEQEELTALFKLNSKLKFVATHVHGTPETMQLNPLSAKSVHKRVSAYFESCTADLIAAGCSHENIYLDPGIGFGKTDPANWRLLLNIGEYSKKHQIAIGVSRKGFIQRTIGGEKPTERDQSSKLVECQALADGASLIRTHDVRGFYRLANVFQEALQ